IPMIWDEKLSPTMTLENLQNAFWSDIQSNIIREIVKSIYYCKDEQHINLIDALGRDSKFHRSSEQIGDLIFSYLYHGANFNPASNLIAGVRVTSGYIMEAPQFINEPFNTKTNNIGNLVYLSGRLGQSNVFVDATTSWT